MSQTDANINFLRENIHRFTGPFGWKYESASSVMGSQNRIVFFSTINGYHVYRVKPRAGCALRLQPEPDNVYDRHALKVLLRLDNENEDQIIGRVPKKISELLSTAIQDGSVTSVTVFCTGAFKHLGPIRGGGPQLCACYVVEMRRNKLDFVKGLQQRGVSSEDVFL